MLNINCSQNKNPIGVGGQGNASESQKGELKDSRKSGEESEDCEIRFKGGVLMKKYRKNRRSNQRKSARKRGREGKESIRKWSIR